MQGDDGLDTGPWSPTGGKFTVDTATPLAPTVSSSTWSATSWSTPTTGTVSWSSASGDVDHYIYKVDTGGWSQNTTATSKSFTLGSDARHTVQVKAVDKAGNVSAAGTYAFGIGGGGVLSPAEGAVTQARVTLSAQASPDRTYVYYQWRAGTAGTWANVPVADVTLPGTNTQPATWPVVPVSGTYTWNLANTAGGNDGVIQVQGCVSASASGSSAVCQATPTDVQLARHAFSAANATEQVGPGTLAELTGDYSIDATDVNVPAYDGSLSLSRSLTTLLPAAASTSVTGVFGPGWTASLTGPDAGDAGEIPTLAADKSYVTLTDADGGEADYVATSSLTGSSITYRGLADANDGSVLTLSNSASTLTLVGPDGTSTIWTVTSAGKWVPSSVIATGDAAQNTSSYYYNTSGSYVGLPSRIVAPAPSGVDCSSDAKAASTQGCRSLTFAYTTAAGASRLAQVSLVAWDPATSAMVSTAVAAYDYAGDGHLADEYDPRISPALKTAYTYDGNGRLATITPPGMAAWTLSYDGTGRVSTLSRPDPSGSTATTTIVYDLPLLAGNGVSGVPDVSGTTASGWDETGDLPTTGTAVFGPTHVPAGTVPTAVTTSDWPYASISYLDVNGRDVNDVSYGAGGWQIAATQYDSFGNTVWSLTAENRAEALAPTAQTDPYVAAVGLPADRADLLASVSTYSADGTELVDQLGPMHQIAQPDGTLVDARAHTVTTYDEGAPNSDKNAAGQPYRLPTTVVTSALGSDGTTYQAQTSHTGYNPIDGSSATGSTSGWTLGAATSSTDAGGLVTYTRYNAAGQVVEQRLPGDSAGTGPRTTLTSYYTASGSGACVNAAEAGLLCSAAPAVQPSTGSPLPVVTYGYDRYDNPVSKTETYGSGGSQVVRTTTTAYDAAERQASSAVSVSPAASGGTAVPAVSYGYSTSTGLPTTVSTTTGGTTTTLTTGYNSVGEATSYTDAGGVTSSTGYDVAGRPVSANDGKGTTTYTYDPYSGLMTGENVGVSGALSAFTATYDADGNLVTETYPNGLVASRSYDDAGELTDLDYVMAGSVWLDFEQDFTAQGQVADQSSPLSAQTFGYDGSGRLTTVQDALSDPGTDTVQCTTRVYVFNADSDRTGLRSYPDAGTSPSTGACSTSTTPVSTSYAFDQADRLTGDTAGSYGYDVLGRTTSVPSGDAGGIGSHAAATGVTTVGYYANDMVASQAQGSETMSFALDPAQNRVASFTDNGTTTVNHYADDSDSPAWSVTGSNWSRNLVGLDGGLAATADQTNTLTLQLSDPHGDVVATCADSTSATSTSSYSESTEYGLPRSASTAPSTYGWLGGKQRSTNDLAGLTLMGVRLYNPATGRFLSVDPVPGGNANTYTYPNDPITGFDLNGRCSMNPFSHNNCVEVAAKAVGHAAAAGARWVANQVKNLGNWIAHHKAEFAMYVLGVAVATFGIVLTGGLSALLVSSFVEAGSWGGAEAAIGVAEVVTKGGMVVSVGIATTGSGIAVIWASAYKEHTEPTRRGRAE